VAPGGSDGTCNVFFFFASPRSSGISGTAQFFYACFSATKTPPPANGKEFDSRWYQVFSRSCFFPPGSSVSLDSWCVDFPHSPRRSRSRRLPPPFPSRRAPASVVDFCHWCAYGITKIFFYAYFETGIVFSFAGLGFSFGAPAYNLFDHGLTPPPLPSFWSFNHQSFSRSDAETVHSLAAW